MNNYYSLSLALMQNVDEGTALGFWEKKKIYYAFQFKNHNTTVLDICKSVN